MIDIGKIKSPILLRGDCKTAYRDPAVYFHEGTFYLYFTLVETESDGTVCMYLAMTQSDDLIRFAPVRKLTRRDRRCNYSSPGDVVRFRDRFYLCCQTYCRENGEKFGNDNSRIWLLESDDLVHWSEPEIIRVKGDGVPVEEMGRMIDPYLIRNDDGLWYCFFKQNNGVSFSRSADLEHWTPCGNAECGENVCIVRDGELFRLWYSPVNGIGEKTSRDLKHWRDSGRIETLGQQYWPWAKGRITAGMVLDLRRERSVGRAFMFFHGTGPEDERTIFDQHACIGFAWSDDLKHWKYIVE